MIPMHCGVVCLEAEAKAADFGLLEWDNPSMHFGMRRNLDRWGNRMTAGILVDVGNSAVVVAATDSLGLIDSLTEQRLTAEAGIEAEVGHSSEASSPEAWGALGSPDLDRQKAPRALACIADTGPDTESIHRHPEAEQGHDNLVVEDTW
jgi:hypothetical protein